MDNQILKNEQLAKQIMNESIKKNPEILIEMAKALDKIGAMFSEADLEVRDYGQPNIKE